MPDPGFSCPACGYPGLTEAPWRDRSPSDEICACCGIQFGYDDVVEGRPELRPAFYRDWGLKWRLDGMKWWSANPPPDDWDADTQFRSITQAPLGERSPSDGGQGSD